MKSLTQLAVPVAAVESSGFSTALLHWVGAGVLYGTLLALCTWIIVRVAGRRIGPALHGALWLVVLLKFVLPAGPGWTWSLSSLTRNAAERLHVDGAEDVAAPMQAATAADAQVELLLLEEDPRVASAAAYNGSLELLSPAGRDVATALAWLAWAYIVGVAVAAAVRLTQFARFARHSRNLPPADIETCIFVRDVCRRIGVRQIPDVRVSGDAPAPYILGVMRPLLVLSRRQMSDGQQLEAVVLHELAHLRRGDLFIRYVQWFVGTALFFWPVVAWVNRRIDLMREHACDVWALRYGTLRPSEYARCLLEALEPVRSDRLRYCPAAMAANVKSVERRIDMILESPRRTPSRRWLGVPVVALLAAWCGFALTGAASPVAPAAEEVKDDAQKAVKIVVQQADGNVFVDETEEDVEFQTDDGQHVIVRRRVAGPDGAAKAMFIGKDGNMPFGALHGVSFVTPKQLAQFYQDHPTADVDADGKISRIEHDAYLTARAMLAPGQVLGQFPKADRDENGVLDGMEAARLVAGPGMFMQRFNFDTDGAPGEVGAIVKVEAHVGADGHEIHPQVVVTGPDGDINVDEANVIVELEVEDTVGDATEEAVFQSDDGQTHRVMVRRMAGPHGAHGVFAPRQSPARWVLDNVQGEPTTYDVSVYLDVARRAPHAAILERHPDADLDGDGALSKEEMDGFVKSLHENINTWIGEHGEGAAGFHVMHGENVRFDPATAEPGEWTEEYTDENGNLVKVVRTVTVKDGKVEVSVNKTVGQGEKN